MSKPVDLRYGTTEVFNEDEGYHQTVGAIFLGDEAIWTDKSFTYFAEERAEEHLRHKLKDLLS